MIEEKELLKLAQETKKKNKILRNEKEEDIHLAEWQMFYLNNLDIFVEEFLGVKLYFFQKQMLLEAWKNDIYDINASRGISKTFTASLIANSLCLLMTGINVVVAAMTLGQASKIINEKIDGILCDESKEGHSEIMCQMKKDGYIKFGKDKTGDGSVCYYGNGSKITAVVCGEGGRSNRSNVVLLDEAALVKKEDYERIILPTLEPYRHSGLFMQPKQIFMTSSKTTDNWFYKHLLENVNHHYKKDLLYKYGFFFGDELTSVANGVHTIAQYESNKTTTDDLSFKEEYLNVWLGEKAGSLYCYEDFHKAQILSKPFYPRTALQYTAKEEIDYEFDDDDIRFIAMDIAIVGGKENDNTAILLGKINKNTLKRSIEYVQTKNGMSTLDQVVLIKRLYYEYKCSYFVYDTTGIGNSVFSAFTVETYDSERDITYPAWGVCEDKKLQIASDNVISKKTNLVLDDKREFIIIPIVGTSSINSEMFLALRKNLKDGVINLLKDEDVMEKILSDDPYWILKSSEEQRDLILPFRKTRGMINESISLDTEIVNNVVKVKEKRSDTKDMFMALVYFNYFSNKLADKFSQQEDEVSDFDISQWSFLADACKV